MREYWIEDSELYDSVLVRNGVEIAYICYEVVFLCDEYEDEDREAVMEYAGY